MEISITGQVAAITGAGGVLCSHMALELAKQGARVAVLDLDARKAEQVAAEINASGRSAIAIPCDVMERGSVESACKKTLDTFGRVDILINGAGGNKPAATTNPEQSFFDLPAEALKWVFDLNLLGTILPCQVFGKSMSRTKRGSIVNISSMAAFLPLTHTVAYSAAKAGISNFTKWLAVHMSREYTPEIRVNAIAPGFLLTEQNRFLLQNTDGTPTARGESVLLKTPMNRYGAPEELAGAVVFLCSPAASFITGVVLPIDGGFSAFAGV